MVLSESFWIFVVTTTAGLFLACMKVAYDSKCKTCDLGCIKIERDTGAEIEAEHDRMEHNINQFPEAPRNRESVDRIPI
jgi:predicted DCC family thiol-disulfide oxidoreductase YuxK